MSKMALQRRISIGFLVMTLLVVAAGLSGVAFTQSAERANQVVRNSIHVQSQVNAVRRAWLASMDVLGEALASSPTTQAQIDPLASRFQANIAILEQTLRELQKQSPGASAAERQQNLTILNAAVQSASVLRRSGEEILRQAGQPAGLAAAAQSAHLQTLQRGLSQNLDILLENTQQDIDRAFQNSQRMRNLARLAWMGLTALGALLGFVFTIIFTRSVVRPIQELTQVVQRVTSRDFSPLKPSPSADELGDLWSSLALLTDWLRESYENLETRVNMRTRELERRSTQMQVAAEVARDATSVRSLEALLSNAVELIRGRFGFYHAGIFLNDERGEYTLLQAATGEAGRRLLSQGHRLQIGEVGLVGQVAQTGKPRISSETSGDNISPVMSDAHVDSRQGGALDDRNPLLPATRSQIALPLKIGERIIGVLDVHSQFANAFSQDDVNAMQILADQLAVAIENARLINDYQESLRELEAVYLRLSRSAWADIKRSRNNPGYVYDLNGIRPLAELDEGDAPSNKPASPVEAGMKKVEVPLLVRGNRIASLEVWLQESQYNPQVGNFLQLLGPRLSQSLETARLYQETQERAARERLVGEISGRLRETLNIDYVLRTAAAEIRSALGLNDLTIRLGDAAPHPASGGNGSAIGAGSIEKV